jgi:hypothetical protein
MRLRIAAVAAGCDRPAQVRAEPHQLLPLPFAQWWMPGGDDRSDFAFYSGTVCNASFQRRSSSAATKRLAGSRHRIAVRHARPHAPVEAIGQAAFVRPISTPSGLNCPWQPDQAASGRVVLCADGTIVAKPLIEMACRAVVCAGAIAM